MYPHMILSFALALSFSVCLPSIVEVKHRAHTYRIYCVLRHFLATVYPVCKCVCVLVGSACTRLIYCARLSAEDVCVIAYRRIALYVHVNELEK